MNEREMFEEWVLRRDWCLKRHCQGYADESVDLSWEAWQASAQREGYKLVPVEINDDIESAMFSSVVKGELPCDIYKAMIGAAE